MGSLEPAGAVGRRDNDMSEGEEVVAAILAGQENASAPAVNADNRSSVRRSSTHSTLSRPPARRSFEWLHGVITGRSSMLWATHAEFGTAGYTAGATTSDAGEVPLAPSTAADEPTHAPRPSTKAGVRLASLSTSEQLASTQYQGASSKDISRRSTNAVRVNAAAMRRAVADGVRLGGWQADEKQHFGAQQQQEDHSIVPGIERVDAGGPDAAATGVGGSEAAVVAGGPHKQPSKLPRVQKLVNPKKSQVIGRSLD